MSAARGLVVAAVAMAAGFALYFFCVLPWRCNVVKKARLHATEFAFDHAENPSARMTARRNVDAFIPCLTPLCSDVSLDIQAAANYRVLGEPETAIRLYRDALRRDQRPELYVNLATLELAAGDGAAARLHALRASQFNIGALASIDNGLLRDETARKLIELYPDKADYIRYFQNLGPLP